MANLYIQSHHNRIDLESLITLYVYQACQNDNVLLRVLPVDKDAKNRFTFKVEFSNIKYNTIAIADVPEVVNSCVWPVILVKNKLVSGLASISRQLISLCDQNEIRSLLGFREACLMAPSETSVWTRFCEIDIIHTVTDVLGNEPNYCDEKHIFLPKNLTRFENHMKQPVRIHNVYKEARLQQPDKLIKSGVPINELNLNHTFGEGPFMTLADLLLYPCYKIIVCIIGEEVVKSSLPLSWLWYKNVEKQNISHVEFDLPEVHLSYSTLNVVQEELCNHSNLFMCDPYRYNRRNRIYTKQADFVKSFEKLTLAEIEIPANLLPYGFEINFKWSDVPMNATPLNGALPKTRANRKSEQLENLAKAVIKIVNENSNNKELKIVDFCSGGGHLGILLATMLPQCQIILVENKEKSLLLAHERVLKLKLDNVTFLQCNLDYFCAQFDIGVSLHACGVATDLVIQVCLKNNAHFICCPCCYGGIQNCHQMQYPRSNLFRKTLLYKDYITFGHCADQTHDSENAKTSQGFTCMNLIDTDRKLHAEEYGYKVHLGKLQPSTCTPKNNLLVGIKC